MTYIVLKVSVRFFSTLSFSKSKLDCICTNIKQETLITTFITFPVYLSIVQAPVRSKKECISFRHPSNKKDVIVPHLTVSLNSNQATNQFRETTCKV